MKTALVCIGLIAVLCHDASAISVTESADTIKVDTGQIQFAFDTGRNATLRWVQKDGRRLVDRNATPLLSARLMESAIYDSVTDFAPGRRFLDAQYTVDHVDHTADTDRFAATMLGRLQFEHGDCLRFTIRLVARSGEARSRDIMMKLSDYYVDIKSNPPRRADHSGRIYGLFTRWEMTGDDALRAAVVRSARATLQPGDRLQQGSASLGLLAGFAALYARQDDRFRDLILADMSEPGTGSRDAFRMVLPDPKHWTGETASLSRQSPLCWFYMVNLPVIMAAVGREPQLHDRIWARFDEANDRQRPAKPRAPFHPRPSWQDEYDAPELSDYFAPWRP